MNVLLNLAPEEVEALADWWAGKIGQGSEAESDRACARIEQLHRLTAPERRYDIEHEPADWPPMFMGIDLASGPDHTVELTYTRGGGFRFRELPTPSRFREDRKG